MLKPRSGWLVSRISLRASKTSMLSIGSEKAVSGVLPVEASRADVNSSAFENEEFKFVS
jgi:hypothetical protein